MIFVLVVVDVYFVCGFAHMELLRLVDLLSCLSGALHLLDMVSYYHSICRHLQSQTVSEHNASCECYSSHIETEKLAMKLSNELRA